MKLTRKGDVLELRFSAHEALILRHILSVIDRQYQIPPDQIDPKVSACWYSTRGCQSAHLSQEETEDWVRHLFEYKSKNAEACRAWKEQLGVAKPDGFFHLPISTADAALLLTVLNDHRLMVSARHDIGQAEMDLREDAVVKLPPEQQQALFEIHFLAWIMEGILHHLSAG